MTRNGNDIFGLEDRALFQNASAQFGKSQPVGSRVVLFKAPRGLYRLESHSAHAGLLQGEVDDLSNLPVIEPLLQGHDERSRNAEPVEPLECLLADVT